MSGVKATLGYCPPFQSRHPMHRISPFFLVAHVDSPLAREAPRNLGQTFGIVSSVRGSYDQSHQLAFNAEVRQKSGELGFRRRITLHRLTSIRARTADITLRFAEGSHPSGRRHCPGHRHAETNPGMLVPNGNSVPAPFPVATDPQHVTRTTSCDVAIVARLPLEGNRAQDQETEAVRCRQRKVLLALAGRKMISRRPGPPTPEH